MRLLLATVVLLASCEPSGVDPAMSISAYAGDLPILWATDISVPPEDAACAEGGFNEINAAAGAQVFISVGPVNYDPGPAVVIVSEHDDRSPEYPDAVGSATIKPRTGPWMAKGHIDLWQRQQIEQGQVHRVIAHEAGHLLGLTDIAYGLMSDQLNDSSELTTAQRAYLRELGGKLK